MKVSAACANYFRGFCEVCDDTKTGLALLKIASYFTIVIPLAFAATYAVASLWEHKWTTKTKPLSSADGEVERAARQILKGDRHSQPPVEITTQPSRSQETMAEERLAPRSSTEIAVADTAKSEIPVKRIVRPTPLERIWLDNWFLSQYANYLREEGCNLKCLPCVFGQRCKRTGKDYMRKDILEVLKSLSSTEVLAIPLLISGNHYVLLFIDPIIRTVEYYDSKKNYGPHAEIVAYLEDFTRQLTDNDSDKPYKFICKIDKELQLDCYQCAPWTLYFLEERLKDPNVDFNQLQIKESQKMIADYRAVIMSRVKDWSRE